VHVATHAEAWKNGVGIGSYHVTDTLPQRFYVRQAAGWHMTGGRVLIVEDDPGCRELYADWLGGK